MSSVSLFTCTFFKNNNRGRYVEYFAKSNLFLSDCNWSRTHNHLVHKRTLNYLAKGEFGSLAIRPVWLNGWVFVYELSGCGFESSCSRLNFWFRACFEKGVPWYSGNYRVWIHSETRAWHVTAYSILFVFFCRSSYKIWIGSEVDLSQLQHPR